MYGDALLLEMVSDRDIAFALRATGAPDEARLPDVVRALRGDPQVLQTLVGDARVFEAVRRDPEVPVHVSPYFYFYVLLRRSRDELAHRTFTAEWLAPRHRVPVFDAQHVAEVLWDPGHLHYLAELMASFTRINPGTALHTAAAPRPGRRTRRRFSELDLNDLRALRQSVISAADRFAVERRLGDVALMLAGVFPDSARGSGDMDAWENETRQSYRQAAREPVARAAGLEAILEHLGDDAHIARKALNYVADRFLQPLRDTWFRRSA
jgi:hypothetical protein